ncbi:hypothetical protein C1645_821227 [Glomus cerebriforme]|uniref:Uncharacterized protein n=1 Tax=Glomus cerebriforme TaxID=658196 RepID=A0A397T756_9GLOM|nr:hypothetical protein C1645_821227 [Glomus cerebriforme]
MNRTLGSFSNSQYNQKLINYLKLIESQPTICSLAVYNSFKSEELLHFRKMFCNELDNTITGSELFSGELLTSINYKVYYNEAYNDLKVEFILMNYLIEKGLSLRILDKNEVSPRQFGKISPRRLTRTKFRLDGLERQVSPRRLTEQSFT